MENHNKSNYLYINPTLNYITVCTKVNRDVYKRQELGKYLRIYCNDKHNKWAEYLPSFENAINENYSEATSYTPIELDEDNKPVRFSVSYTHLDVYKRQQQNYTNTWTLIYTKIYNPHNH